MTTFKFTIWLFVLYFIYYAVLMLWDLFRSGGRELSADDHQLTFAEYFDPIRPGFELSMDDILSPIISSGGISLRQLFNEAQEEKIEYTRQVSF